MEMKNVLVTGGAGFIGSNFIRHLLRSDGSVRIVTLDSLTYAGSQRNLDRLPDLQRHLFVRGDICDGPEVRSLIKTRRIDTIVHFAAETHVDRSIHNPEQFVRTNVLGTFTLLDAARRIWLDEERASPDERRFHHVSTDEVFGSLAAGEAAFREDTAYKPNSPYAASKAASDHLVRAFAHTYGLPVTITNCSNNYGPYQFPEKLIPLTILNALEGRPLPLYGDGKQIRDWLYVEDHCEAIRLVLRKSQNGAMYNVGGDNQPANIDLVKTICALLDELRPESPHRPHAKLIAHVPDRPGHDRRYAMDIAKIRSELGWSPREGLESGLRKTVGWYLENLDWVRAVQGEPRYQDWLHTNYAKRGGTA
jgi:dTDP-glucose 4,6-dehydratase